MKKPFLICWDYVWKHITSDSDKIDQKDNIKLIKELLFKDNSVEDTILMLREIKQESELYLEAKFYQNLKENIAIEYFFNPIAHSFKDRAAEIKEKHNYSFKNDKEAQEYAKC